MDLDAYVNEHGGQWRRLERLARRRRLPAAEVDELVALYQRAGTHLSVIRSRSPDPALVARLTRIVLSARATLTGTPVFSWRAVGRFFTAAFPAAVRAAWRWWCAVATVFTVLSLALMQYVAGHPEVQTAMMSPQDIDKLVNQDFAGYYSQYGPQNFALEVWTHNALLTAECLAAGVVLLPVLYLLWGNAVNLGVVGGIMIGNGHGAEFFGLVTPHGLLELTAVFVAAGTGLRVGWSWIAPGPDRTRGQSLTAAARSAMPVALGLACVLAVSGLLEAFVTPSPLPTAARVGTGLVVWLAFLGYVVVCGRRRPSGIGDG